MEKIKDTNIYFAEDTTTEEIDSIIKMIKEKNEGKMFFILCRVAGFDKKLGKVYDLVSYIIKDEEFKFYSSMNTGRAVNKNGISILINGYEKLSDEEKKILMADKPIAEYLHKTLKKNDTYVIPFNEYDEMVSELRELDKIVNLNMGEFFFHYEKPISTILNMSKDAGMYVYKGGNEDENSNS